MTESTSILSIGLPSVTYTSALTEVRLFSADDLFAFGPSLLPSLDVFAISQANSPESNPYWPLRVITVGVNCANIEGRCNR